MRGGVCECDLCVLSCVFPFGGLSKFVARLQPPAAFLNGGLSVKVQLQTQAGSNIDPRSLLRAIWLVFSETGYVKTSESALG